MAWPGMNLALQWVACAVIIAWAVWFLASKLVGEFKPHAGMPKCPGCSRCHPGEANNGEKHDRPGGERPDAPAAKLKSR